MERHVMPTSWSLAGETTRADKNLSTMFMRRNRVSGSNQNHAYAYTSQSRRILHIDQASSFCDAMYFRLGSVISWRWFINYNGMIEMYGDSYLSLLHVLEDLDNIFADINGSSESSASTSSHLSPSGSASGATSTSRTATTSASCCTCSSLSVSGASGDIMIVLNFLLCLSLWDEMQRSLLSSLNTLYLLGVRPQPVGWDTSWGFRSWWVIISVLSSCGSSLVLVDVLSNSFE